MSSVQVDLGLPSAKLLQLCPGYTAVVSHLTMMEQAYTWQPGPKTRIAYVQAASYPWLTVKREAVADQKEPPPPDLTTLAKIATQWVMHPGLFVVEELRAARACICQHAACSRILVRPLHSITWLKGHKCISSCLTPPQRAALRMPPRNSDKRRW